MNKKIIISKEVLKQKYIAEQKTIQQTAKELKLSNKVVYNRLKEYSLIRIRSESAKIAKHRKNCKCAICRDNSGNKNGMFRVKSPNYIDGRSLKEYYCKKCNKKITYQGFLYGNKMCRSCSNKEKILSKATKQKISKSKKKNPTKYWLNKSNKNILVNHHIYLKENSDETMRIKQGLHRSLHFRAYEYVVRLGLIDKYLENFCSKYKINPNLDYGKILHHKDCDRANNNPNNLMYLDSRSLHSKLHQEAYSYLVRIDKIQQYIKWFLSKERKKLLT